MKILVLGSTGMLGHKMVERLQIHYSNVVGLSREKGLDARDLARTEAMLRMIQPDVVINCVGIVKQREQNPEELIAINSLFPHFLKRICADLGIRLIHFSTDCVFSGKKGRYTEFDQPDAEDAYGSTKYMGEVTGENVLTLRTSIIGREKTNYLGLLEWFLKQKGDINGYGNCFFSGVTTNWLSDVVVKLLDRKDMSGRWQIASEPISKLELLKLFQETYDRQDIKIIAVAGPSCDRSLDGYQFEQATGIETPSWPDMLITQREQDKGLYAV